MREAFFYMHGGSKNHGCEAIVRSTIAINSFLKIRLFSHNKQEDLDYQLQNQCMLESAGQQLVPFSMQHWLLKLKTIIKGNNEDYFVFKFSNFLKNIDENSICISIGGDNYCYKKLPENLIFLNKKINEKNGISVLWECSLEPKLFQDKDIVNDLKSYSLITARESITYNALVEAGINKNTYIFPDSAFTLNTVRLELPKGFVEDNTVGINVSPLIIDCETNKGATMRNYTALIQHIIDTTDMQIALIPHVVWDNNDDRKPLRELYEKFISTGRVIMIEDHNCMELKGYIARCRIFIGARTHATIAAYSSCVPTLVVGYSVKAKGIAKDIFGTYENYVIPVQTLENKNDMINAFEWIKENEVHIKNSLKDFMPEYIQKAWQAGKEVEKLIKK